MSKLIFHAPINSLSLGNVAVNLLRSMHKKGLDITFFPVGNNIDFKAYKLSKEFADWFGASVHNRLKTVKKDTPSLRLWHINGSELKYSDKQYLMTFYELNSPTQEEINLVKLQEHTFFSSTYSKTIFGNVTDNVSYVPMGFDDEFVVKPALHPKNVIHFGLMGKWENRKHTEKIIKLWIKKYGDNHKYQLTCCVTNPFYKPEQMNQVIMQALGGKRYFNVNFLPYLDTNAQVNDLMNNIDIDLTGLAGAEGWNLPAFNCTTLGKWSVVLNATAHKDWANKENAILVQPNGQIPAYDGIFFQQGQPFNQGSIYTWDEDEAVAAFEAAEKVAKTTNTNGEKLREKFTWDKSLDIMLKKMEVS